MKTIIKWWIFIFALFSKTSFSVKKIPWLSMHGKLMSLRSQRSEWYSTENDGSWGDKEMAYSGYSCQHSLIKAKSWTYFDWFLLFNRGHTDEITINIFLLYYIKQRDPMLPWIFSVMNHWRGQNVVRTSVTYSAVSRKQRFCFFIFRHHLWSSSAQVQDNIESACWIHITKMRPFKDDFCSGCVW